MSLSITRPLTATVLNADQVATAPASNAFDDRPGKVWRASTGTSAFVILDLGAGSGPYDTLGIVGCNLRGANTIRVRTGTTTTGTGSSDTGQQQGVANGSAVDGMTIRAVIQFAARTERYVRIDFVTTTSLEAQRIVIGPSITATGMTWDSDSTLMDGSGVETNFGADTLTSGLKKLRWKFGVELSGADWRTKWLPLLAQVGKTYPVLFIPNVEQPDRWQAEIVFGRIRNDVSAKIPGADLRTLEMTIEGLAI